jgi:hypothetical protein
VKNSAHTEPKAQKSFLRIDLAQRVSLSAASNVGVFMDVAVGSLADKPSQAKI